MTSAGYSEDPRLTSHAPFSADIGVVPSVFPNVPSWVSYPAGVGLSYSASSVLLGGSSMLSPSHFSVELLYRLCSLSPSSASAGQACFLGTSSSLHLLLIFLLLGSNCLLRRKCIHVLVEYLRAYVRSQPRQSSSRQEAFLSMGNGEKLEKVQREGKTEALRDEQKRKYIPSSKKKVDS